MRGVKEIPLNVAVLDQHGNRLDVVWWQLWRNPMTREQDCEIRVYVPSEQEAEGIPAGATPVLWHEG